MISESLVIGDWRRVIADGVAHRLSNHSQTTNHQSPVDLGRRSLRVRRVDLAGFKPAYTYVETSTDTGRLRLDMTVTWQGIQNDKGSVTVSSLVLR